MEIAISSLVILTLLLVASNVYWALIYNRCVDKLMSRDFYSYQQAKQITKTAETELAEALKSVKIPEQTGPNELDSLDAEIKKLMPFG